jgi:hypothetical protein
MGNVGGFLAVADRLRLKIGSECPNRKKMAFFVEYQPKASKNHRCLVYPLGGFGNSSYKSYHHLIYFTYPKNENKGENTCKQKKNLCKFLEGVSREDNEFIFAFTVFRKLDPFHQFPITAQYVV